MGPGDEDDEYEGSDEGAWGGLDAEPDFEPAPPPSRLFPPPSNDGEFKGLFVTRDEILEFLRDYQPHPKKPGQ